MPLNGETISFAGTLGKRVTTETTKTDDTERARVNETVRGKDKERKRGLDREREEEQRTIGDEVTPESNGGLHGNGGKDRARR